MTPLRQRMINDMTVRGLANSTMASYLRSVTRLARHYRRSPDQISAPEVQAYLLFLHQHHGLCWTTCNTIRHGMRFFYRITLGLPDPHFLCARRQGPLHAAHRGRDAGYPAPPAQIRAGALTHTAPAFGPTTGVLSTRCAGSHAVVVGAPPVSRFPGAASGTCFGSSTSRWPRPFPPPTPPGSHSPLFAGFIGTI